jgi:hypothetical protein
MLPDTERVLDWQAGNRCAKFEFADISSQVLDAKAGQASGPAFDQGASAKDRFNNLFKP